MFKRYWWILLVMLPVGLFCGFLLAAAVTYVMPKKYESFATIEVKPRMRMDGGVGVDPASLSFLGTEFERFQKYSGAFEF